MTTPRSTRRHHASWSGPLSSLFGDRPSPKANENAFVFPPRAGTPIQDDSYKASDRSLVPSNRPDRPPLSSKSANMPVAPYPYDQLYSPVPYQSSGNYRFETQDEWGPSSSQYRKHRHTPASSAVDFLEYSTLQGHSRSASSHYIPLRQSQPVTGRSTLPASSSQNILPRQLRHRRSRSESFSLPRQRHYHSQHGDFLEVPDNSMQYGLTHGRPRSLSNSYSRPSYVPPLRTSTHPPRSPGSSQHSRTEFIPERRRVRFIVPATLHMYLRDPPFRFSVKRPPPSDLVEYYPYLYDPATKPTVSFLLITTPLLPWSIRLAARSASEFPSRKFHDAPLPYLSVQQVLNGIYMALRQYITLQEYESLALNKVFCNNVIEAYRKRKAQEGNGESAVFPEPMRRVDWLAGRALFKGLEESNEGEGVWKLRLS